MIGDPAAWADRLRSFDRRFLERVVAVWPRCLAALPDRPDEDVITTNLVDLLSRDAAVLRRFHWIEYQYEPFGHTRQGTAHSKGRIDVAVFLNQDRDRYLAYECKRLNELRDDGRRSLAGEYVREGLSRFVAEQYSENLPVGCMLGYVLDGDVRDAALSVRKKIVACRREIALIGQPHDEAAIDVATGMFMVEDPYTGAQPHDEAAIDVATRFSSRHRRRQSDSEIEIRHALLPVRLRGASAEGAPGGGHAGEPGGDRVTRVGRPPVAGRSAASGTSP